MQSMPSIRATLKKSESIEELLVSARYRRASAEIVDMLVRSDAVNLIVVDSVAALLKG